MATDMNMAAPSRKPAVSHLNRVLLHPAAKPALWLVCAFPLAVLVWRAFSDRLGANPAESLIHSTGEWALRWLWATLAITPLRQIFQMPGLLRFRRALGVSAFVYALLHFVAYAWLDKGLVIDDIVKDVFKRNFIFVGLASLVLMTPLALTSFNSAIRALGGKRWQMLHKLVYAVALLALLHFLWKKAGKNDFFEVGVYALVLAGLLGWRFGRWSRQIA